MGSVPPIRVTGSHNTEQRGGLVPHRYVGNVITIFNNFPKCIELEHLMQELWELELTRNINFLCAVVLK